MPAGGRSGMHGDTMSAVRLNHVSFRYEGYEEEVLKDVSLEVNYHEVALLCGLSGSGKSTILSLISGIIPHITPGVVHGDITIDDEPVNGRSLTEICRKVGIVLQNADNQIIQSVVEDEIAFGCENIAMPPEEIGQSIDTACRIMSLDKGWQTRTLSGGQKQRLITASILAMKQRILILDEPLANLDWEGAILLMNALRELAAQGYAVLIVEHRIDMVLPFVDKVWNILHGQVSLIEDKTKYLHSQAKMIEDHTAGFISGKPLFEFKNVAYSIKKRTILKDISFTIHQGERILFLGENGCGKTTTTRLLAGLIQPSSGEIRQFLTPKGIRRKDWFKRVGVIYQNPNYQLFMPTVRQEIAFNAVSEEMVEEMLELFHLKSMEARHPHSLSEGQKRKLTVAVVLASSPEVLILDEPTVGQDYDGLKSLVEIINQWHSKTGSTVITVSHDIRCAEALCDTAIVIQDGIVSSQGGKEIIKDYFHLHKNEL